MRKFQPLEKEHFQTSNPWKNHDRVAAISCSNFCWAAPESTDCAATARPSVKSRAFPPATMAAAALSRGDVAPGSFLAGQDVADE
jgi:hypothetical protein